MDLKEFISATFAQIIEGVDDARKQGADAAGVASNFRTKIKNVPAGLMQDENGALYTIVDFDVAVTEGASSHGKAGISIVPIAISGGGSKENQTVSRVKFAIPMRFNIY